MSAGSPIGLLLVLTYATGGGGATAGPVSLIANSDEKDLVVNDDDKNLVVNSDSNSATIGNEVT